MAAIVYAFAGAVIVGFTDFAGGSATRAATAERAPLPVVVRTRLIGLLVVLVAIVAFLWQCTGAFDREEDAVAIDVFGPWLGEEADAFAASTEAFTFLTGVEADVPIEDIRPGDLLVASSTPGHAMRAEPNPPQGTVIGKALEKLDASRGTGFIKMLVTLQ